MKLKKIQSTIQEFKEFLKSDKAYENNYLYEGIKNFQEHWDAGRDGLAQMYLEATKNTSSKRMWKSEGGHPREVMSAFFHYDPTYTKFIFKDLFNENLAIESRLDRYTFHCDQLYDELKEHFTDGPHDKHYQTKMIGSIHLAFHTPENYLIYDWDLFSEFLPLLEVPDPPTHEDSHRYFKVSKVLNNFLMKDEEVFSYHLNRLDSDKHYIGESRMLVLELMSFATDRSLF